MNYEFKYIKYKHKYIELKNLIGGKLNDTNIWELFSAAGMNKKSYEIFIKTTNFKNYIKNINDDDIKKMINYIVFLEKEQTLTRNPNEIVEMAIELKEASYIAVSLNKYWGITDINEIKQKAKKIYATDCTNNQLNDEYIIQIFNKYNINDETIQKEYLGIFKKQKLLELPKILELYMFIQRILFNETLKKT
jgi:hypothetical protein